MQLKFIRKGGRIIPIKSDISSVKKATLLTEVENMIKVHKTVNSPFIKKNVTEKIKSLIEKIRLMEQMA